ncbi:LAMI_0H06348g1_1 [Lachancea mirantina]|uniref:Altered inheritance of mitochondria protein 41 n=1 Tax=Lachancea mirantina TaxID=1230905 RepID=A0A1G4KFG1_9SACH|nr:LAMI_0H06348g1_1 [Lachancea mirantina]
MNRGSQMSKFRICLYGRSFGSARLLNTAAYDSSIAHLKADLKKAMQAKDDASKTTIRSVLSSVKNSEIDAKGKTLDEFALADLYTRLLNQRKESINHFLQNNREDLAQRERFETQVIEKYLRALPIASREEIDTKVFSLLQDLKLQTPDMQLKQIFGKIDWQSMPSEWKASAATIRSSIAAQFKKVFT